jgi:hypothetical protein
MALALVSLAVVIGVIVIVFVNAAGPATAEEGEAATLSGGATAVTDAAASGGKALQFAGGTTSADPVIAAAGDIACSPSDPNWNGGNGTATGCAHKTTAAAVINLNPTAVLALGDNQYEGGALADYNQVYAPSWGQFKNITYPVIGNHEYGNAGAAGYWNYFGDRATPLQPGCRSNCNGWYSFDIGTWHIVALNSECNNVSGGCSATSPQATWLKADLAAHTNKCTLAMWHEPYWAGGVLRSDLVLPLIQVLYDNNADLILNGHDHLYDRYAPQNPQSQVDTARGIRQITVGSGGRDFSGRITNTNQEFQQNTSFGILSLTLHPTSYDWKFIPSTNITAASQDSGTTTCH